MKVCLLALVSALPIVGATQANASVATIEADASEFYINLDQSSIDEGAFVLNVNNLGSLGHVIAIEGTGISTSYMSSGASASVAGELAAGTYNIICTISGHAAAGMSTSLVVSPISSPSTTASDSTITTTTTITPEVTTDGTQTTVEESVTTLANSGSKQMGRLSGGILMLFVGACMIVLRRGKTSYLNSTH